MKVVRTPTTHSAEAKPCQGDMRGDCATCPEVLISVVSWGDQDPGMQRWFPQFPSAKRQPGQVAEDEARRIYGVTWGAIETNCWLHVKMRSYCHPREIAGYSLVKISW